MFVGAPVHGDVKGSTGPSMMPERAIALINQERSGAGVAYVTPDATLQAVAQQKATQMASAGEFAHTLSDGTTAWGLLQDAAYRYQYAGENLAVHFKTESAMVDAWMASTPHRVTMLNDVYTEVGIGMAPGEYQGYSGIFVVLLFASPFVL